MLKINRFASFLLLVILIVAGCDAKKEEDLFKYKDSYIGDNSAVGSIVHQLQHAEYFKDFELKTKDKPYGMILNYDESITAENATEVVVYNATFIFTLVQNADWITFNFDNHEYKVTRNRLQNWYGENLSDLESEDETKKLIQKYLEENKTVAQMNHSKYNRANE